MLSLHLAHTAAPVCTSVVLATSVRAQSSTRSCCGSVHTARHCGARSHDLRRRFAWRHGETARCGVNEHVTKLLDGSLGGAGDVCHMCISTEAVSLESLMMVCDLDHARSPLKAMSPRSSNEMYQATMNALRHCKLRFLLRSMCDLRNRIRSH
jgi:hypothetical protein